MARRGAGLSDAMTFQRQSARQRGYTWEWEKERAFFLSRPENQFCVKCKARGLLNTGTMRMVSGVSTDGTKSA